eukprot:1717778-Amphidinium_carterae.2
MAASSSARLHHIRMNHPQVPSNTSAGMATRRHSCGRAAANQVTTQSPKPERRYCSSTTHAVFWHGNPPTCLKHSRTMNGHMMKTHEKTGRQSKANHTGKPPQWMHEIQPGQPHKLSERARPTDMPATNPLGKT